MCIYGNCHTMIISDMLSNDSDFLSKYAIYQIPPIQKINDKTFFDSPCFSCFDVFIHQSIREENQYGKEYSSKAIIKKLKKDCKVIAVPNLFHMPKFLFPQCNYDKTTLQWRKGNTVFFRDNIIDKGLVYSSSIKKNFRYYQSQTIISEEDVKKSFLTFKEKLLSREKDWDIKVSDYIMNNFQTKQLFYDPSHPTNEYLEYIVLELKELLLGIKYKRVLWDKEKIQKLDVTEMPVLDTVRNALGITYSADTLRNSANGGRIISSEMDTKEYIHQYILLSWRNTDLNIFSRAGLFIRFVLVRINQKLRKK